MKLDTIEQIENSKWGEPGDDSTGLVKTIFALRKKDICLFSIEDLRILIGQNVALDILIPIAIEKLNENFFSEGDFYKGDLLHNVLISDRNFWEKNFLLKQKMFELFEENKESLKNFETTEEIRRALFVAYEKFV